MITHDEARQNTIYFYGEYDNARKTLNDYITQQEQFAKDVARFFELFMNRKKTIQESTEMLDLFVKLSTVDLFVKLSKVGKKSE